jgi:hypothetical protein
MVEENVLAPPSNLFTRGHAALIGPAVMVLLVFSRTLRKSKDDHTDDRACMAGEESAIFISAGGQVVVHQ